MYRSRENGRFPPPFTTIHDSFIDISILLSIIFTMSDTVTSGQLSLTGVSAAALKAFREGRLAARNQEYGKAVKYYTDALSFKGLPSVFHARLFEYRGQCHWLLGEFEEASEDYETSLTTSNDLDQTARARVRLGELADFRGQYQEAEKLYQQALGEGVVAENLLVIGRARRGLGVLYRRQGNTETAVSQLTQSLAAFRQAGEAREQGRVLTSLGRTRQARGEYQHALNAHKEAYTILESVNDRWRLVQALNDIGECHQALYDVDTALKFHQQALQRGTEVGAEILIPEIKRNLGLDLVELGQYEQGLVYLQAALDGARNFGNREAEALALYHLARAYLRHEDFAQANQAVNTLYKIAETLDVDRYRALAAFVRGELLFYQGEQTAAIAELNVAMLAAQTSVDRGVLWKLHATMSHVSENENIAAVHLSIAADFIRQTAEPLQDSHLKSCFVYAPPVLAVLQAANINPDKL
ncbi:MAG: tetratricopeptide repeat protein [Chloroflexi bacterium]|nr:tetratricopeptide repeat protein [Chloroflexota bacterium]